ARPWWDRGLRGPLPLGTSSTKRDVTAARNLRVRIGVRVVAFPVIPLQLVAFCVPALASRPTHDEGAGPEEGDRDQGEDEGQGLAFGRARGSEGDGGPDRGGDVQGPAGPGVGDPGRRAGGLQDDGTQVRRSDSGPEVDDGPLERGREADPAHGRTPGRRVVDR